MDKRPQILFAILRLCLGWVFFWAFLDKTFGLGYSTASENAWVRGGSPTAGYLGSRSGTFGDLFQSMADSALVEWLFMVGLLGIGLALLLGIGMKVAAWAGTAMLLLMWAASLPLTTNPFLDDHLVYAVALLALAAVGAGRFWGLGTWWADQDFVKKNPWLE